MKKILYIMVLVSCILLVHTAFAASGINWADYTDLSKNGMAESNPNGLMAHNIYANPVLSGTSGRYSGFVIEMKADYAPKNTYWALCNWSMDTTSLTNQGFTVTDGGGAYCGLQNTQNGTTAIMSFWQIVYKDKTGHETIHNARLTYPTENGNGTFGNEGSGTNYITPFSWKAGQWYRLYLTCYDDAEVGHTVVEMWVQDETTGEWTEICAYDTGLTNSCFIGNMSQFMENYWGMEKNYTRTCEFRGYYVRDASSRKWIPITNVSISVDTWWDNKKGSFNFGSTDTSVFGVTNSYGPDQAVRNSDVYQTYELDIQPVLPEGALN